MYFHEILWYISAPIECIVMKFYGTFQLPLNVFSWNLWYISAPIERIFVKFMVHFSSHWMYFREIYGTFQLPLNVFSWNFMVHFSSHWMYFHEILYVSIFRKFFEKFQAPLKSDKNKWYFTWRPKIHFWPYLAQFFLKWETVQRNL
jgi:hypothetical protein